MGGGCTDRVLRPPGRIVTCLGLGLECWNDIRTVFIVSSIFTDVVEPSRHNLAANPLRLRLPQPSLSDIPPPSPLSRGVVDRPTDLRQDGVGDRNDAAWSPTATQSGSGSQH